jgi:hypothetical protein
MLSAPIMLAATRWVDSLSSANLHTRSLLFYSLGVIAVGLYSIVSRSLFPSNVSAGKPTQELRKEPPALVNLLVNDLVLTADAATAVLLDLTVRGHFTISNSESGVESIDLAVSRETPALKRYEQLVSELVCSVAAAFDADGAIELSKIKQFASTETPKSRTWWSAFRLSVVEDALRQGLVVRRCSQMMTRILRGLAVALILISMLTLGRSGPRIADPAGWAVGIFTVCASLSLIALAQVDRSELRFTKRGITAASHWLGSRSTMQHVGSFSELGPAAVNIWGTRMAYATALGVARETTRRLHLVNADDSDAWYVTNERWYHARTTVPAIPGWGLSPWRHLKEATPPFFVSAAALGSVGLIIWFGKIKATAGERVGIQGVINQSLRFPQRIAFAEWRSVIALALFGGLLWVLRGHLKRAAPVYHALLDLVLTRRENGVIAVDANGWIGIGNPHVPTITLYRVPDNFFIEPSFQVELVATRFFGRIKRIRPYEPPKPKRSSFR